MEDLGNKSKWSAIISEDVRKAVAARTMQSYTASPSSLRLCWSFAESYLRRTDNCKIRRNYKQFGVP
jgi:hypothetical protein